MDNEQPTVAHGYCQCGCGERTTVSTRNVPSLGHVKGEPIRFVSGHNARYLGPEWREEDRGYATPCWIWQLDRRPNGYGVRRIDGVNISAHRRAWEATNGPIVASLHVHHLCHVRACVNPAHLKLLGSSAHVRAHHATLTAADAAQIRASLATFDGYGACTRLAKEYGVSSKAINDIKLGKTWADLDG